MLLFGFYILSCLSVCALGCHRGENGGGATRMPPTARPTMPRYEVHHDPEADIWLGEMEFVNLFCGTGRTMPPILSGVGTQIRGIGSAIGGIFQRQRRQAANGQTPTDINQLTAEELNKYKLDHSLLYFRGKAYEWGAGMFMRSFRNGTVDRNPMECGNSITWTLQGRSNCTFEQMNHMAHSYIDMMGDYALLTNNCHHFVERMVRKLRLGHCEPFLVNP